MILTDVTQDSAHELRPVPFGVSILDGVGKCLTRETSDKRGTKKASTAGTIENLTEVRIRESFRPRSLLSGRYAYFVAVNLCEDKLILSRYFIYLLFFFFYLNTQVSLLSSTTVWSKSNTIRIFIFVTCTETRLSNSNTVFMGLNEKFIPLVVECSFKELQFSFSFRC